MRTVKLNLELEGGEEERTVKEEEAGHGKEFGIDEPDGPDLWKTLYEEEAQPGGIGENFSCKLE